MSDIQELEAEKERHKLQVEKRDLVLKLSENFEFRKVIHDGFMNEEAARAIRMAGEPTLKPEVKDAMINMAMAAGHLQRYLSACVQAGHQSEDAIKQIDAALEELRAEGAE